MPIYNQTVFVCDFCGKREVNMLVVELGDKVVVTNKEWKDFYFNTDKILVCDSCKEEHGEKI